MRLKDKVAIITGAARGIGAAFAVGFANTIAQRTLPTNFFTIRRRKR